MQRSPDRVLLFTPIKYLFFFLVFTEVLYFVGPLEFGVDSNFLLFFYLLLLNASLYYGYKNGLLIRRKKTSLARVKDLKLEIIKRIIFVTLVYYFIEYWFSLNITSISSLFQKVIFAVQNSGEVYQSKLESSSTSGLTYIMMLLSPFPYMAQIFGVYYWGRLSKTYKIIVIIVYLLEITSWLASGTRKGLFDIMIIVLTMFILYNPDILIDKKKKKILGISLLSGIVVFILYFVISNLSRYGFTAAEFESYDIGSIRSFYQNNLPFSINLMLSSVSGYLCQGYRALSLALNDFVYNGVFCYTYGLGSSWFDINLAENVFGVNPLPYTYQGYLENQYGIDGMVNWHTLYLWLANDFTFIGTPFVIYWLGYLFANSWYDALYHYNKFAAPMAVMCTLIITYSFANNQVLSFSFVPFFVAFVLYIINR